MRACAVLVLLVTVLAACRSGNSASSPAPGSSAASATGAPSASATSGAGASVPAADRAACAQLYASLQRVTLAVQSSSELLTRSQNKQQLGQQIAVEQVQLRRSAQLVDGTPAPGALVEAKSRLVSALRAFSADFARAKAPAARGDYARAVAAMTDKPVVERIVAAATAIEKACG